jgi:hypothetical protein
VPHAERGSLWQDHNDCSTAFVDLQANDAFLSATGAQQQAMAADSPRRGPSLRLDRGTVAEQVLASELRGRQDADALSMMVSSMVHMVQAGKTRSSASRWSA